MENINYNGIKDPSKFVYKYIDLSIKKDPDMYKYKTRALNEITKYNKAIDVEFNSIIDAIEFKSVDRLITLLHNLQKCLNKDVESLNPKKFDKLNKFNFKSNKSFRILNKNEAKLLIEDVRVLFRKHISKTTYGHFSQHLPLVRLWLIVSNELSTLKNGGIYPDSNYPLLKRVEEITEREDLVVYIKNKQSKLNPTITNN